jgi:TPR repeat protein
MASPFLFNLVNCGLFPLAATRQRAEQGDAIAQTNLGVRYANGRGVQQDYVEAHKWYNLAASACPSSCVVECRQGNTVEFARRSYANRESSYEREAKHEM